MSDVTRYSAFSIKERLDAGDTVPATFYAAADYDAMAQRLAEVEGALRVASLNLERVEWQNARMLAKLVRIHSFMGAEDVHLPDGRTFRFDNPEIERDMLRGLSAAIRDIPSDLPPPCAA